MNEKQLRKQIYEIITETVYNELRTFYPTKEDFRLRPDCKPFASNRLMGKRKAARKIVKFLNDERVKK